jgi:hypothetical protein
MDLEAVFGDRIISHGLWPAHLLDFIPWNFYLWGNMKNKVLQNELSYQRTVK